MQNNSNTNEQINTINFGLDANTIYGLNHQQIRTIFRTIITPENKIQCYCYIIMNRGDTFRKILKNGFISKEEIIDCIRFLPSILLYLPQKVYYDTKFQKLLIANMQPGWYDFLPSIIADMSEVQIKCNRTAKIYSEYGLDANGYNRDWVNSEGMLLNFFTLKANFPIKTKEDYYKLYEEYVKANTSVNNFCERYGISSETGFKKLLERIKAESYEDAMAIKNVGTNVSKDFYFNVQKRAKQLATGELSFEDFISNKNINFYVNNAELYFNALDYDGRYNLAKIIFNYIEANPNFILKNFFIFLKGREVTLLNSFMKLVKSRFKSPDDNDIIKRISNNTVRIINSHEKPYSRKFLYCKYIKGEETNIVDDAVIDQALAYAEDNGIYKSLAAIAYLSKRIAFGELNYFKESEEKKDSLLESILDLIDQNKDLDAYIKLMKKSNNISGDNDSTIDQSNIIVK